MQLKDFIGKVVISTYTKRRFFITEITAPKICAVTTTPEAHGRCGSYAWRTINGDPFTNGDLVFEDPSLLEPFKRAFDAYCRTEDAYWENYDYWMRKD